MHKDTNFHFFIIHENLYEQFAIQSTVKRDKSSNSLSFFELSPLQLNI